MMKKIIGIFSLVLVGMMFSSVEAANGRNKRGGTSPTEESSPKGKKNTSPKQKGTWNNGAAVVNAFEEAYASAVSVLVDEHADSMAAAIDGTSVQLKTELETLMTSSEGSEAAGTIMVSLWAKVFAEQKWGHLQVLVDNRVDGLSDYLQTLEKIDAAARAILVTAGILVYEGA